MGVDLSLRAALSEIAALLLPVRCVGCAEPDRLLCDVCRDTLRPQLLRRSLPGGLDVTSALSFEGVPARVIRALKQDGRTSLAGPLGSALAGAAEAIPGPAAFVPVPTSRAAFRRRGYGVVELLLARAGLPATRALRSVGALADQRTLDATAREANVQGSMRAVSLPRSPVVIVDDVLTTGATLREAQRALREAGASVFGAMTLAATARRTGADARNGTHIGNTP